jgi:hypothetical protein
MELKRLDITSKILNLEGKGTRQVKKEVIYGETWSIRRLDIVKKRLDMEFKRLDI